ncbi:MAG: histidine kinase N-terminal 7TM domain-containing protein [Anaerolineales bacterium]
MLLALLHPYTLLALISACLCLFAAYFAWHRRGAPGARALLAFLLEAAFWCLAYALELVNPNIADKLFWAKMQYFGILSIPITVLVMVLQYTGLEAWITRRTLPLAATLPTLMLPIVWTNESHRLLWVSYVPKTVGALEILTVEHGIFFWVIVAYAYLCLAASLVVVFFKYQTIGAIYRAQLQTIGVGLFFPWFGNLLYLLNVTPRHLDLTPFAFSLSALAAFWGMFRLRLLDITPLGRDAVVETLIDPVLMLDADLRIVDFNPAAARVFKLAKHQVEGNSAYEVLSAFTEVLDVLRKRNSLPATVKIDDEGEWLYYDARLMPLQNRRKQSIGWVLVLHDVTTLYQAEEHLRERNARLQRISQVVEQNANSIVITNLDGTITYINPRFEEMSGYARQEALGQTPRILKSGYQGAAFYQRMWQTIGEGRIWQGEILNQAKDGSTYWVNSTIFALRDEHGNLTDYVSVASDITLQKQAESALQERERYLSLLNEITQVSLGNNLALGVVMSEIAGLIAQIFESEACAIYINQADTNQIRLLASFSERSAQDVPPVFVQNGVLLAAKSLAAGNVLLIDDVFSNAAIEHKPAAPCWIKSVMVVPIVSDAQPLGAFLLGFAQGHRFHQGDVLHAYQISAQMSLIISRLVLVQQLQDSIKALKTHNNELDAFAHTVAHDLKNPIAAMLGFSELLTENFDNLPSETALDFIETIRAAALRTRSIVDELLLLSNVRSDRKVELETLDMETIIQKACERLSFQLSESKADLFIVPGNSWPKAIGYAPWVEAVWANYISNAIKYGGRPPKIEIGAKYQENKAFFGVRDNGFGLTVEQQQRLFTPFERLHTSKAEGHGLGLTIVQRIVNRLGGEVGVESNPQQGSLFYFTLPIASIEDNPRSAPTGVLA